MNNTMNTIVSVADSNSTTGMPLHGADIGDRMEVMFWQEITQYKTADYLDFAVPLGEPLDREGIMSEQWRTRMCEWAYQLVDHFDFPRHIVGNAMNFLDRYLEKFFAASPGGIPRIQKKQFQLITMCCLYVAMKILGHSRIPVSYMVQLSRGTVQELELIAMEKELLAQLSWRVNPPTAFDFLKHYLRILQPASASTLVGEELLVKSPRLTALEDLAAFLVELSVLDYFFVNFRPSTVALASLFNAMDEDPHLSVANPFLQAHTLYHGYDVLIVPGQEEAIYLCRQRLGSLYQNADTGNDEPLSPTPSAVTDDKNNRITSPVSVLTSNNPYYH